MVNRAYSFKQLCEKSDATLRNYINSINLSTVTIQQHESIVIQSEKSSELFNSNSVLPQSSLFSDIFNDATSHTLVEDFSAQEVTGILT